MLRVASYSQIWNFCDIFIILFERLQYWFDLLSFCIYLKFLKKWYLGYCMLMMSVDSQEADMSGFAF